ncbi:hypothetical protein GCM10022408_21560 [Hymenobacter fastidiosus]|uniref:SWIM-type domain-containing protein n=1 Tax=Hymenobacter fastidiosus TaxID=486264 RepID=A0ABP7SB21_9BACT
MFTRQYLQSLASPASFARGEAYFRDGSVGSISREADTFTAKVRGSSGRYQVKLTLLPAGDRLRCTCPYDFEGICKHRVALGLAVLHKFGPQLQAAALPNSLENSPKALETALRDTAADTQLAFLAELLRARPDLRQQFLARVAPAGAAGVAPPVAAAAPAEATPDSISTEVYEALSDLAFDDEQLSEHAEFYEDYRYDEGDGMLELADAAIAEVLEPYALAVAAAVQGGRLTEALRCWIGVCEGAAAATEPADDDYDLFSYEGYPQHVLECWLSRLSELGVEALLETRPFAAAETEAALALLFGRYPAPAPLPAYFQPLLYGLAHDPATATRLLPLLAQTPITTIDLAHVLLRVAEVLADDALWLRTAEAFADQDVALTIRLLDHYRQHHDRPNMLRVLSQWQPRFYPQLNPYILTHLTPAEDEPLYLAALEQRCRNAHSLDDYHELKRYWSAARRQQFVEEQLAPGGRSEAGLLFGAELLAAENRDAELLPYLLRHNWGWQRTSPAVLALAARTRPNECLDAVMEHTEALLQDSLNGRGRDVYQRIVSWLTALNAFESLRPQVALFAAHLYAEYSRLSALREELRGARLVRVEKLGSQYRLLPPTSKEDELRALMRDRQQAAKLKKR